MKYALLQYEVSYYVLFIFIIIYMCMQLKQGSAQLLFKIFSNATQDSEDLKQKNTISMQNINTIYIKWILTEHDSITSNHKQITDIIKQAY